MPLAVRLHRPGDDRRRRLREGAAHRPGRARDRRPRARARSRRRWIVDFTNPVGIVTRSSARSRPPRRRPLQRRDRVSADVREDARESEPERVQIDQVGLNHLSWVRVVRLDGEDVLAGPPRGARRRDRRDVRRGAAPDRRARRRCPSYYLHYFYGHDQVARRAARRSSARDDRRGDRARAAGDVPRPEPRGEAGAARAARRRVLQRGRHWARRRARDRQRRRRTWSTCGTTERSRASRTTTSIEVLCARRRRRREAAAAAGRSRRSCSGSMQHVDRLRAARCKRGRDRRSGNRAQGAADASADRPASAVGGARRPPARSGLEHLPQFHAETRA